MRSLRAKHAFPDAFVRHSERRIIFLHTPLHVEENVVDRERRGRRYYSRPHLSTAGAREARRTRSKTCDPSRIWILIRSHSIDAALPNVVCQNASRRAASAVKPRGVRMENVEVTCILHPTNRGRPSLFLMNKPTNCPELDCLKRRTLFGVKQST